MARCYHNLLVSAAHANGGSFTKVVEVEIQEESEIVESRAGGNQGPVAATINTFRCSVDVVGEVLVTPMAKSTAVGAFTVLAKDNEAATATVSVAGMKIQQHGMRVVQNEKATQRTKMFYEGTSIDPITVSG